MVKLALAEEQPTERSTKLERLSGWINEIQDELDDYFREMKEFSGAEPDQVFLKLAAWSARASEIRSALVRQENRRAQAFRTREIDPFLDELDRQFRIHSRVVTIRQQDWEMTRGPSGT